MNTLLLLWALNSSPARESQCQTWWQRGQEENILKECALSGPAPRRQFWSLRLTRDPNDLRRQLSSAALEKRDSLDARTLLLAAQYHFGREQTTELKAIHALARKRFPGDTATAAIQRWLPR